MGNQTSSGSGAAPLPGRATVQPQRKFTNPLPTDRVTEHGAVFLKPQVVDQRYDTDQAKTEELPEITALRSRMGHAHPTAHPQWSEHTETPLQGNIVSDDLDWDPYEPISGPRLGPNA
jgi:hypothetical protein